MKVRIVLAAVLAIGTGLVAEDKMDPKDTEVWDPEPTVVSTGTAGEAPSDALVLFDGTSLDAWHNGNGGASVWTLENGIMTVPGPVENIQTREKFGSVQLHLEWRSPAIVSGEGQGRGNSGVFLQERYEIQVLDSHNNRTYANGQAGSVYKQHPPLVNATKAPGEWQTYDIIYKAPTFDKEGSLMTSARVTVLHNGVLIQNNSEIQGTTVYVGPASYEAHGEASLILQHHDNPVSYRNIWIRRLMD